MQTYALMTGAQIADEIAKHPHRHVVVTGGEPCRYDLNPLANAVLDGLGRTLQVETSGTSEIRLPYEAWVTLSPKIGMPGRLALRPEAVARANEIKMPVGKPADVAALQALLHQHHVGPSRPVWLQPLSRSAKATAFCLESAAANGWRVSIQIHSYIGVR
ncbi:MAG: hypothetical protein NVS2B1_19580 [Bradyrhizobium sp.]